MVLSGGELFPDALSANYLATELGTGTLLTRSNSLSPEARQAILDSDVENVYITGGTAAVSQSVEDEIKSMHVSNNASNAFINVIRLGGADRYATNRKINTSQLHNSNIAILAAGTAPYDSLAVGPIVYNNSYPLVLTNGSNLNNGEETQLQNINANTVVIVGGLAVVSQAVEDQLKADGYNVVRLAGATRYATATAIATWGTVGYDFNGDDDTADNAEGDQGLDESTTFITNGLGFADALVCWPRCFRLRPVPGAAGQGRQHGRCGPREVPRYQDGPAQRRRCTHPGAVRPRPHRRDEQLDDRRRRRGDRPGREAA